MAEVEKGAVRAHGAVANFIVELCRKIASEGRSEEYINAFMDEIPQALLDAAVKAKGC